MEKVKILVVEDECIIAQSLCRTLERLGYTTLEVAASGEKAISLAEKHNPDLVLMDIILKGEMDGIETARIILSSFNIPVIYVTSCQRLGYSNKIVYGMFQVMNNVPAYFSLFC